MRIALDTTYSLGSNLSGVGVYSRELLAALAAAHPDDQLLCYYRPHRFFRSFKQSLPANASRRLLRAAPSGDVFHALNQRVDHPGRRTVSTFHDLFVMTSEYSSPEFRQRFTEQARQAAEHSDLIIAVSAFTASQVEELLNVDRSRIRVIPHGVRVPNAKLDSSREAMILSVGAIQKRKNTLGLVRAFEVAVQQLSSECRLVLAGAPNGYGAEEALQAIEASEVRDRIEVLGYVTGEKLEQLWAQASVFAFPSLDEGFGMPILEAMVRGVPVVTSDRSAMPEVAGDAALLVDPENTEQLANALVELATNPERADQLRNAGLVRADEFSWQRTAAQVRDVYRELV